MKIYIIRHGETNGNLRGVLQGWTDEPLNSKGRKLAQITGKCLASIGFDIAISSPLSRAYETCEIVLRENRNPVPTIEVDDRLKEINFGCWENLGITKKIIKFLIRILICFIQIHFCWRTRMMESLFVMYAIEQRIFIWN